jgi:hypothetical protein
MNVTTQALVSTQLADRITLLRNSGLLGIEQIRSVMKGEFPMLRDEYVNEHIQRVYNSAPSSDTMLETQRNLIAVKARFEMFNREKEQLELQLEHTKDQLERSNSQHTAYRTQTEERLERLRKAYTTAQESNIKLAKEVQDLQAENADIQTENEELLLVKGLPPQEERCQAQKRDGFQCTRRHTKTSHKLCGKHIYQYRVVRVSEMEQVD